MKKIFSIILFFAISLSVSIAGTQCDKNSACKKDSKSESVKSSQIQNPPNNSSAVNTSGQSKTITLTSTAKISANGNLITASSQPVSLAKVETNAKSEIPVIQASEVTASSKSVEPVQGVPISDKTDAKSLPSEQSSSNKANK